jgi:hypothetical protein
MTKAIVLAVIFILTTRVGFGQNRLTFRSTEWLGLSAGEAGNAVAVQTVNGLTKGPWFAGVGAGIDYYRFRSAPLFLSVTRDIAVGKKDWLFLYVDGGANVAWYKPAPIEGYAGGSDVFHGGSYWNGGLGYVWKLGEHTGKAIQFTAGYVVKRMKEDQLLGCPIGVLCDPGYPRPIEYDYLLRAFQFMAGFRF